MTKEEKKALSPNQKKLFKIVTGISWYVVATYLAKKTLFNMSGTPDILVEEVLNILAKKKAAVEQDAAFYLQKKINELEEKENISPKQITNNKKFNAFLKKYLTDTAKEALNQIQNDSGKFFNLIEKHFVYNNFIAETLKLISNNYHCLKLPTFQKSNRLMIDPDNLKLLDHFTSNTKEFLQKPSTGSKQPLFEEHSLKKTENLIKERIGKIPLFILSLTIEKIITTSMIASILSFLPLVSMIKFFIKFLFITIITLYPLIFAAQAYVKNKLSKLFLEHLDILKEIQTILKIPSMDTKPATPANKTEKTTKDKMHYKIEKNLEVKQKKQPLNKNQQKLFDIVTGISWYVNALYLTRKMIFKTEKNADELIEKILKALAGKVAKPEGTSAFYLKKRAEGSGMNTEQIVDNNALKSLLITHLKDECKKIDGFSEEKRLKTFKLIEKFSHYSSIIDQGLALLRDRYIPFKNLITAKKFGSKIGGGNITLLHFVFFKAKRLPKKSSEISKTIDLYKTNFSKEEKTLAKQKLGKLPLLIFPLYFFKITGPTLITIYLFTFIANNFVISTILAIATISTLILMAEKTLAKKLPVLVEEHLNVIDEIQKLLEIPTTKNKPTAISNKIRETQKNKILHKITKRLKKKKAPKLSLREKISFFIYTFVQKITRETNATLIAPFLKFFSNLKQTLAAFIKIKTTEMTPQEKKAKPIPTSRNTKIPANHKKRKKKFNDSPKLIIEKTESAIKQKQSDTAQGNEALLKNTAKETLGNKTTATAFSQPSSKPKPSVIKVPDQKESKNTMTIPDEIKSFFNSITSKEYETYITGSAIRNFIHGKKLKQLEQLEQLDIITTASIGEIYRWCQKNTWVSLDQDFFSGDLILSKSKSIKLNITVSKKPINIESDARTNRAFTCHAVYYNLNKTEDPLRDPTTKGMSDISSKTARATRSAEDFSKNLTHILHLLEFITQKETKDFTIDKALLNEIRKEMIDITALPIKPGDIHKAKCILETIQNAKSKMLIIEKLKLHVIFDKLAHCFLPKKNPSHHWNTSSFYGPRPTRAKVNPPLLPTPAALGCKAQSLRHARG